jgi:hypothetical protein
MEPFFVAVAFPKEILPSAINNPLNRKLFKVQEGSKRETPDELTSVSYLDDKSAS